MGTSAYSSSLLIGVTLLAAQLPPPEAWARADAATRRLAPSEFSDLPQPVRAELDRRGCSIPQAYTGGPPHNVVRGAFRSAGQHDVAVLCSRARTSAILIFWGGDPRSASEIAAQPDANFLQEVAPGRIGFSRAIAAASPESIRQRSRRYADPLPPSVAHDGIHDAFIEKASVVWYWHEGKWLQLAGAN
jgi:hypothetical protein